VITAVLACAAATDLPFVRVRWAADGAPNPVLVRRSAWALAAGLEGDRGLGPLLAERPDLVAVVAFDGHLPDVDTPADLASLHGRPGGGRREPAR
jgi:CTP:molybdopterin cytidylyltransferase MocA